MRKEEGLVKCPIVYLRHIKILSCHMVSIYSKHNLTWNWQICVYIHHQIMLYHIGNVCCIVVRNLHVLIFRVQNQISTIKMLSGKYVFMCINKWHIVLWMTDILLMKRYSVNCMRLIQIKL